MRSISVRSIALTIAVLAAGACRAAGAVECCTAGCATCIPRWEDKKSKTPKYSLKCEPECVRGFDRWCDHGCCPEDTSPCGGLFTKKKLFKREQDKVERILKYTVGSQPCGPCAAPACPSHSACWYDPFGLCRRLFGGR